MSMLPADIHRRLEPKALGQHSVESMASIVLEIEGWLEQIKRGTHDSCPTRLLTPGNALATTIDQWWLQYFNSQQSAHKLLARQALGRLALIKEMLK